MRIVEAVKVSTGYQNKVVTADIDFVFDEGGFVFFLGDNGSGKTAFVKTLLGILKPLKGTVTSRVARDRIGYIPQKSQLEINLPMTVEEFVSLGSVGTSLPKSGWKDQINSVLDHSGLKENRTQQLMSLSGGQFQRASVARALVRKPRLLIADEPTSGLDRSSCENLIHLFHELNRSGVSIILVTHDHLLVKNMNGTALVFKDKGATLREKPA